MEIKKIYQVVAYMVEDDYPEEALPPYEYQLVATANKRFANLVERMYQKLLDEGKPTDYLNEWCFHGLWYIDEIRVNTIKCFM